MEEYAGKTIWHKYRPPSNIIQSNQAFADLKYSHVGSGVTVWNDSTKMNEGFVFFDLGV